MEPDTCERQTVVKGKWLNYYSVDFPRKDGSQGKWEYVGRPWSKEGVPDGVTIIPIIKKGGKKNLLLISEFRRPVEALVLSFPGGRAILI